MKNKKLIIIILFLSYVIYSCNNANDEVAIKTWVQSKVSGCKNIVKMHEDKANRHSWYVIVDSLYKVTILDINTIGKSLIKESDLHLRGYLLYDEDKKQIKSKVSGCKNIVKVSENEITGYKLYIAVDSLYAIHAFEVGSIDGLQELNRKE